MGDTQGKDTQADEITESPKPNPDEERKLLDSMSVEDRVKYHYEHGQGSIQDIARVYRMEVSQVLHLIGEDELNTVTTSGDMVDAQEAGPGAQLNYQGKQYYVPYSTD